jgi:circadian clock protein KaiC
MGPAGTGKSTLLALFASAALARGQNAALFLFDENIPSFLLRARALGITLDEYLRDGRLSVRQVDPAELSPGEFAHAVRDEVETRQARFIGIDSLNGYVYAMPHERFLTLHIHELLNYLNHRGATTMLLVAQHGLVGPMSGTLDLTYVADAVLLVRFFEAQGRVRRVVSMFKKRGGAHEDTLRELVIGEGGIIVGPPLRDFQGVLTGTPTSTTAQHRRTDDGEV